MGSASHAHRLINLGCAKTDMQSIIKCKVASKEKLFERLSKLQARGNALQLFDIDAVIDPLHLDAAYENALRTFEEGTNIARSIAVEMILFTAFTTQIGEAVRLAGFKKDRAILFSADGKGAKLLGRLVVPEAELEPEPNPVAIKRYGMARISPEKIDLEILTRMAESRLGP